MAKRPYSTQFTARQNPRRYLLSGIPPTLWARAQARAKRENIALRQVILFLVEQWVDRPDGQELTDLGIKPFGPKLDRLIVAARTLADELESVRGGS